jgi:hypothetical protein
VYSPNCRLSFRPRFMVGYICLLSQESTAVSAEEVSVDQRPLAVQKVLSASSAISAVNRLPPTPSELCRQKRYFATKLAGSAAPVLRQVKNCCYSVVSAYRAPATEPPPPRSRALDRRAHPKWTKWTPLRGTPNAELVARPVLIKRPVRCPVHDARATRPKCPPKKQRAFIEDASAFRLMVSAARR